MLQILKVPQAEGGACRTICSIGVGIEGPPASGCTFKDDASSSCIYILVLIAGLSRPLLLNTSACMVWSISRLRLRIGVNTGFDAMLGHTAQSCDSAVDLSSSCSQTLEGWAAREQQNQERNNTSTPQQVSTADLPNQRVVYSKDDLTDIAEVRTKCCMHNTDIHLNLCLVITCYDGAQNQHCVLICSSAPPLQLTKK